MTYHTNVHHSTTAVHDDGAHYTASGMAVPAADVRSREIAGQGARWLALAEDRSRMKRPTLVAKALSSVAFSVQHGAHAFAVPSKLVGTKRCQGALAALARDGVDPWAPLVVEPRGVGLTAILDDEPLGCVQPKHLPWVRPLLAHGLTLHLARVTGTGYEAYTLGCNVVFGHVGTAVEGLLSVLRAGDGASGDGLPEATLTAVPGVGGGDGEEGARALRLLKSPAIPVRPEHESLTGAPDDVVLYRRIDGTACASVAHVVRHSPTGVEWGRVGSGPADLALSVLTALTDEATADGLYPAFEAEVVARVPHAGGLLRAADVRAWVSAARAGL